MTIDRRVVSISGFQSVQPVEAEAQAQALDALGGELIKANTYLQNKALTLAKDEFKTTASERIRQLYDENPANPAILQSNLNQYKKDYISETPTAISGEVGTLFNSLSDKYVTKSKTNQVAVVNNQSQFLTAKKENELVTNTINLTGGIFGTGLEQASSVANAIEGLNGVHELYTTLGEDGKPLYGAEQRIAAEEDFMYNVLEASAREAIRKSPNKLATLKKIRDNKYIIPEIKDVTKGETKLSLFLPEDRLKSLGKSLIAEMNSEFKLSEGEKNAREQEDKLEAFKFENKQLDAMSKGQSLTLADLDVAKPYLTPDQFVEQSILVSTTAPIASNEQTINRLRLKVAQGKDIQAELLSAYYEKELSDPDYANLRNNEQLLNDKPISPLDNAKKVFTQMQGSFINPLTGGFNKAEDSAKIARATTTFNDILNELQSTGQQIDFQESYDIALFSIASNLEPKEIQKFGITMAKPEIKMIKQPDGTVIQRKIYPEVSVSKEMHKQRKQDLINKYKVKLNTEDQTIITADPQFRGEAEQLLNFYGIFNKWN